MTTRAFVDTTILADALLKPDDRRKKAKAALKRFDETEAPCYALKELRCGPIAGFLWFHNALVETGSIEITLEKLGRLGRMPSLQATANEAFRAALGRVGVETMQALSSDYSEQASLNSVLYDRFRLSTRVLVLKAWRRRRSLTTRMTHELECFEEDEPVLRNGMLKFKRLGCSAPPCSTALMLQQRPRHVQKIRDALCAPGESGNRRTALLKRILKGRTTTNKECRLMGDSVFAVLAPSNSTILTTNIKDHAPLAKSVGKVAKTPDQVLAESDPAF